MKKYTLIAAGLALAATLSACPGPQTPNPTPSATASPSVTPSDSPTTTPSTDPSPSAGPTSTPGVPTATPIPPDDALPTPPPAANLGFSVTGATATKQPDFSYVYTLTGTEFGTAADYDLLTVTAGGNTRTLVSNGQVQINSVDMPAISVAPTTISFRWKPGTNPTSNDLVTLTYKKRNADPKTSTAVRLAAN